MAGWSVIASACSTAPIEPTVKLKLMRPALPTIARMRCSDPVILPDRAINAAETTSLWGRDRAALRACEAGRAAAVAAVDHAPTTSAED